MCSLASPKTKHPPPEFHWLSPVLFAQSSARQTLKTTPQLLIVNVCASHHSCRQDIVMPAKMMGGWCYGFHLVRRAASTLKITHKRPFRRASSRNFPKNHETEFSQATYQGILKSNMRRKYPKQHAKESSRATCKRNYPNSHANGILQSSMQR